MALHLRRNARPRASAAARMAWGGGGSHARLVRAPRLSHGMRRLPARHGSAARSEPRTNGVVTNPGDPSPGERARVVLDHSFRSLFLAASQSPWLREQATRRRFVRRAVSRFM